MGLIINQKAPDVSFVDLLIQLDVIGEDQAIRLPQRTEAIEVLTGGSGRARAWLRSSFGRFLHRELDAAHRPPASAFA